jgi:hypothetical protein
MTFRGYKVQWCNLCETAIIHCDECGVGSCSGGGCPKCSDDFDEFHKISNLILKSDLPLENRNTPEDQLLVEMFGEQI